jgi:cell division protease FtsH
MSAPPESSGPGPPDEAGGSGPPAPRKGAGRPRRPGPGAAPPQPPRFLFAYLALAFLALWLWQDVARSLAYTTLPYSEFKRALERGEVTKISLGENQIEGEMRPAPVEGAVDLSEEGAEAPEPQLFRTVRVEDPNLIEELSKHGVEFTGVRPNPLTQFLLAWAIPIGLLLAFWIFLSRRMGMGGGAAGSVMSFGRSRARLAAEDTGVNFADVAGCDEAKLELREVVEFLRDADRFRALGAKIPKGVLLVGPPGTGKTLLARAVAGEAKVPFFSLSGSEFVEMFVGVGAARVRDLFEQAKQHAPCIVFIDELDAIGRQRGVTMGVTNDEREQTLNQLLVEMDGFEPNSGVILLSATNRPDVLDRALLRPGRFDRQVVLDAPDVTGRQAILKVHARGKPLADDVDLEVVARSTPGFSGADLANVVNEAALLAARAGATRISQANVEAAVERVVAGPERRSRRLTEEDKRRVAYHEVGHALVAAHSEGADPVHKISIVPRGHAALGYTLQLPTDEKFLLSQPAILDRIQVMLGGRAAEEIVFGVVSTGAQDDLERATALAREMVTRYAMGKSVGLVHWAPPRGSGFLPGAEGYVQRPFSEQTAREIDEEVKAILEAAYGEARTLLTRHRDALERTAAELLRCETLDAERFAELIGPQDAAS